MTQEEIKEIERVVNDYRNKKFELLDKRLEIEKKHQKGEILVWQKEYLIEQLYRNLYETNESKKFAEFADKTYTDGTFEKYFRAAHLKAFFNIIVDPEKL